MAISCALIVDCVAEFYGVTAHAIKSNMRTRNATLPRHAAMWLAREMTELSLPQIGRAIGNRDHTTVLYGCTSIASTRLVEPLLQAQLDELQAIIEASASTLNIIKVAQPVDVDAVEVAQRMMNQPLSRFKISLNELQTLAATILALSARDERAEPQHAALIIEARPELTAAVEITVAAFANYQNAQFTRDERRTQAALEAALKGLKSTFETKTLKEINA